MVWCPCHATATRVHALQHDPAMVALSYRLQVEPRDSARLRAKRCGGRLGQTPYTCMLSVVHPCTRRLRPRAPTLESVIEPSRQPMRTILANDSTGMAPARPLRLQAPVPVQYLLPVVIQDPTAWVHVAERCIPAAPYIPVTGWVTALGSVARFVVSGSSNLYTATASSRVFVEYISL